MFNCVNLITRRLLTIVIFWSVACWSYAESTRFPDDVSTSSSSTTDPAYYSFNYEDVDRMLQLIETYRNFRPSNTFLNYGVMFYPEPDPQSNKLRLVAKACVVLPQDAVPLNMAGNYFPGVLHGEIFFSPEFSATFKKDPASANGTTQAYSFAVLHENQVQILLSTPGTIGIKTFQIKVDFGAPVTPATTSTFYNLNIINDTPGMDFGRGATFFMATICPPWWKI